VSSVLVLLGVFALLLVIIHSITEASRRAKLRRYTRAQTAHLGRVADAIGGRLKESSAYGPRVEVESAGFLCSYGDIHGFPPGFDVLTALDVEAEWVGPEFGLWRNVWMNPWMREDATRTPFAPFQRSEPIPGCEAPDGWVVLGEQSERARRLWARVQPHLGHLLPHLDAISASGSVCFYFKDILSTPPAAVSAAVQLVASLRDNLRLRPPTPRSPFRD
jgi:hypothetical protein